MFYVFLWTEILLAYFLVSLPFLSHDFIVYMYVCTYVYLYLRSFSKDFFRVYVWQIFLDILILNVFGRPFKFHATFMKYRILGSKSFPSE